MRSPLTILLALCASLVLRATPFEYQQLLKAPSSLKIVDTLDLRGGFANDEQQVLLNMNELELSYDEDEGKLVLRKAAFNENEEEVGASVLEISVLRNAAAFSRSASLRLHTKQEKTEFSSYSSNTSKRPKGKRYEGVFGIYELESGHYLALIKESKAAPGFEPTSGVRIVKEISLVKVPDTNDGKDDGNSGYSEKSVALLLDAISKHSFYFSKNSLSFDVTRNTQSRANVVANLSIKRRRKLQWRSCDERFFWNYNLVAPLIEQSLDEWIVPVMNAYSSSKQLTINGQVYTLSLVSRRSRHHQGQRYIKRGSGEGGEVANFVETEQILLGPANQVSSFVQVRGSIPIFWGQPDTWKLKPTITPARNLMLQARALKTHLVDLFCSYTSMEKEHEGDDSSSSPLPHPSIFIVNLIDKSGMQGKLGRWLCAAFQRIQQGGVKPLPSEEDENNEILPVLDAAQAIGNMEDLPSRVEQNLDITNRSVVTSLDFSCSYAVNDGDRSVARGFFSGSKLAAKLLQTKAKKNKKNAKKQRTAPGKLEKKLARFIWFDYHSKCKGGKISSIAEIFPQLKSILLGNGAYYMSDKGQKMLQRHIVRTNCIDCLDRTNVVQTAVARWVLLRQLQALGAIAKIPSSQLSHLPIPNDDAEAAFRELWGDNGDMMSLLYAGTKALKRDVTRLGKRTKMGAFDDGINSAMRYYINNYLDERNQMGLDLAFGFSKKGMHFNISSVSEGKQQEEEDEEEDEDEEEEEEEEEEDLNKDEAGAEDVEGSQRAMEAIVANMASVDISVKDVGDGGNGSSDVVSALFPKRFDLASERLRGGESQQQPMVVEVEVEALLQSLLKEIEELASPSRQRQLRLRKPMAIKRTKNIAKSAPKQGKVGKVASRTTSHENELTSLFKNGKGSKLLLVVITLLVIQVLRQMLFMKNLEKPVIDITFLD